MNAQPQIHLVETTVEGMAIWQALMARKVPFKKALAFLKAVSIANPERN